MTHLPAALLFVGLSLVWTWPLVLHFGDHIPGWPGDNFGYLWNLWWMRKVLSEPHLEFFRSAYLLNPFGADLVNHPHTALQAYISATVGAGLNVVQAENFYIICSVALNGLCAYALAYDVTRQRRSAIVAGIAFGGSPYIAAHLLGHFDLLTAWVIPLFALCLRKALQHGRVIAAVGCGACIAVAAYSAYYYVVYLVLFAVTYTLASWRAVGFTWTERPPTRALLSVRLVIVALIALDIFLIVFIAATGGFEFMLAGRPVSVRSAHNPLVVIWALAVAWLLAKRRFRLRAQRVPREAFWRGVQAAMVMTAVFTVLCVPLIGEAVRLAYSGRYVSQTYFWRSAPSGVDAVAPLVGNPFHPLYGGAVTRVYETLGMDRIEGVGWLGIAPLIVLAIRRRTWVDGEEARRWTIVLGVFALWALGPFLIVAGHNLGLPLPQTVARFLPIVDNARIPGRAMVVVYLALGMLMAMRLAGLAKIGGGGFRPRYTVAVIALLLVDYLHAPIPLTALDRPAVYDKLASIDDAGVVIEVPFGIGDGLSKGWGHQDRRLMYYATIHGHPVMGGYLARIFPLMVQAYEAMPVVGNLLRLSNGGEAIEEQAATKLPFRYLVLDTRTASAELIEYVRLHIDTDLILSADGRELHAVHGVKNVNFRASLQRAAE